MPGIVGWQDEEMRHISRSPSYSVGVTAAASGHRHSSFSYYLLPVHLLKLTVLKLNGSSFEMQVTRTASVRELRLAVEEIFSQPQKDGQQEKISCCMDHLVLKRQDSCMGSLLLVLPRAQADR